MSLLNTLQIILNHPLNGGAKLAALSRFLRWQIGSRLVGGTVSIPFVDETRLLVATGMHGATMSIYTGLQEFEDMAFLLHFIKEDDLFVDVGANVGTYTMLASGAVGARTLSIEPVPFTYLRLQDNVRLNNITEQVKSLNVALGQEDGVLDFTAGLDTVNHVISELEVNENVIQVPVKTLDGVLQGGKPALIKIDVEGYETLVLSGGKEVLGQDTLLGVIMELNGSGSRYGYSEDKLHNTMLDYGFSTYSYSPFDRSLIPLAGKNCKSGNTLYLRHIDVVSERLQSAKQFVIQQTGALI